MIQITYLNGGNSDHVGLIPYNLAEFADPKADAKTQLHQSYPHGGGWFECPGFTLRADNSLKYPGDPPLLPRAMFKLGPNDETVYVYDSAFIAVVHPDRTFNVARMD